VSRSVVHGARASTGIRVVDRAVEVLDLLAGAGPGLGVTEIARRVRLGKSTTHRLLSSLVRAEIVRLDPERRVYHLGYRLLQWTAAWLDRMDVRTRALPHITRLREKSQETVILNILADHERVAVERLEAAQEVRFVADLGTPLPLTVGASGKAILAYLPEATLAAVLETAGLTGAKAAALRRTLGEIRRAGSAVSYGERIPGSGAVSAPVFNHQGRVIGSVSILSVAVRLSPDTVRTYRELVRQTAEAVSRDLGWVGTDAAAEPARSPGQRRRTE
jgi:IclR family transcriptional regulator, acetate operon repressor